MSPLRSVFLCYRRDDTEGEAGRMQEGLKKRLSKPGRKISVFMDQTSIPVGSMWQERISEEIDQSDAVLVLIGRRWLASAEGNEQPRLLEETDEVRFEIAKAIELGKPIVPVLVNGGRIPSASELPQELVKLTAYQYGSLSTRTYEADIDVLCQSLRRAAGSHATFLRVPFLAAPISIVIVAAILFLFSGWPPSRPAITVPTSPHPEPATTSPPAVTTLPTFAPEPGVTLVGSPTFDAMVKAGRIRIGTKTDQPGLSYRDSTGNWAGFDVEIENLIAARLGFSATQIDRVTAETNDLSHLVSDHEVDLAISAYTITDFRRQTISFAGPYFQAGQSILVRRDDQQIVSKDTLHGMVVCSVEGSTGNYKITHPFLGQRETLALADTANCVDDLLNHNADAVTTDDAILAGYQQQYPDKLKIVGGQFSVEPWGVGLGKGDKVLCQKVNSILVEALHDGTWKKIFDATLGSSGIHVPQPTPSNSNCT